MESVRKKFPFTRTLNHLIESCPVEDKLSLIEAFIAYGLDGIENELHGRAFELFLQAKVELDKSWKLYRNGCSKPETHHRGGAPKNNRNAAKSTPSQYQNNTNCISSLSTNTTSNNINIKKEKNKEEKEGMLVFDEQFIPALKKWSGYLCELYHREQSLSTIEACYKKLQALSGGDPSKADAIVNYCISRGWRGLYPIPNSNQFKGHVSKRMETGVTLKDNSLSKYDNQEKW